MSYSAAAIANYFLDRYGDMKKSPKISPLKLQKLVYVAHGWSLGILGEELVGDEYAEAWEYGPVFPSIYHEFKNFGRYPIDRNAKDLKIDESSFDFSIVTPKINNDDKQTSALLDRIWDVYGGYTPIQISNVTHKDGSPWHQVREASEGKRNTDIDNKIIKEYYAGLADG